jgi:hypothetical protein
MTNEQKAARLEEIGRDLRGMDSHSPDAFLLLECAALLRGDTAQENARLEAAMKEIAVFAQGLRERTDVPTFVVIGHMIEGYLNKHAAKAAAVKWVDGQEAR